MSHAPEASARSWFTAHPLTICPYGTAHISGTDYFIRSEFSPRRLYTKDRRIEMLHRRIILNPGSGGQSLSLPTQEPSPTLPPSVRQLFDGHEVANMRRRSPQTKDRRAHNGWKGHKLLGGGRPSNGCEDILLPDLFHLSVRNPILFKVAAALSCGFSQVSRLFIILIIKLE